MATGVKAAGAAGGFERAPEAKADATETVAEAVVGTPPRAYGKQPKFVKGLMVNSQSLLMVKRCQHPRMLIGYERVFWMLLGALSPFLYKDILVVGTS